MTIENAVDLAIENTVIDGLTDIFGNFIEVELLKDEESRDILKKDIVSYIDKKQFNQMQILPIQYILIPKSHHAYDYRRGALIHLQCHLKYLTLCLLAAEKIELNRITTNKKIVYSNRFKINQGRIFSNKEDYSEWLQNYIERRKSGKYKVIVQCDIASFFDRVNLHRLESTLQSIGIEDWISKSINDLLEFWAKKDSYGLPIGSNASRILAEATLIDIDNYLIDEGIEYTRYVDDFRFFAIDSNTAQQWITKLITKLFREGLLLNASKTKFIDCTREEVIEKKEPDPAEEVLQEVIRLVGRYNRIPRIFKMPSKEKYEVFKYIDILKDIDEIKKYSVIEFDKVQKVIIASIIQQKWINLLLCPVFIMDCPYGINYIVDMLEKNRTVIPVKIREQLSIEFSRFFDEKRFENIDWYEATILKLLSSDEYYNKKALFHYFINAKKTNSSLSSMIALEGIMKKANRTDVKTIRECYDKCDQWEQRRIIMMVSRVLPEDEKKAWLRSIQPIINDSVTKIYFNKAMKGIL
jgi:hypothetical protein